MPRFYDWEKTLAYDADVTMVVGARGIGKTYGLRKQCIRDFIKRGNRFAEIVRYKAEISDVASGYFDRLAHDPDFEDDWVFKTDARQMYIAKRTEDKPKWQVLGYFISLTEAQKKKKKTYDYVKRLIFDEAILNRKDRFHNYLYDEWGILAEIVDTISRERPDVKSIRPRLYLLGNALDIVNPFFAVNRVKLPLEFGYRWYSGKTFLLHYVEDGEYAREKSAKTMAGRMRSLIGDKVASENLFSTQSEEFIKKKPPRAKYKFAIVYDGKKYGIWLDMQGGYYHITNKVPNNADNIFYLQMDDASVNWLSANKMSPVIKALVEVNQLGLIRYETMGVQTDFRQVLALFGAT